MTQIKKDFAMDMETLMFLSDPEYSVDMFDSLEQNNEALSSWKERGNRILEALQRSQDDVEFQRQWQWLVYLRKEYQPMDLDEGWDVEEEHLAVDEVMGAIQGHEHKRWWRTLLRRWRRRVFEEGQAIHDAINSLSLRPTAVARSAETEGFLPLLAVLYSEGATREPYVTEDGVCCHVFLGQPCQVFVQLPEDGYIAILALLEGNEDKPILFYPTQDLHQEMRRKGSNNLFGYKFGVAGLVRFFVFFSKLPWTQIAGGEETETLSNEHLQTYLVEHTEELHFTNLHVIVEPN
ncbi:MAG: hypothetical protein EP343_00620 [Deltaproteobacteria bacterium]|nr:MAG: hypothetical protein EP343_00620 [Deltaproteobacteria bacterium]